MTIDLLSPLPRNECALRLTTALVGGGAVDGTVSQTSFRLCKRIYYRNSFRASVSGKFIDDDAGTRIYCNVGQHPFVTVFLFVWIGIVSIACVGMIVSLLSGATPAKQWPQVMIPFLMLGGGLAILKFGRLLSGGEADFLIGFVRTTLEAHDSPRAGG